MSEPMTLDEYLNEARKPPGERALYNDEIPMVFSSFPTEAIILTPEEDS